MKNMDQAKDFQLLSPGRHHLCCTQAECKQAKKTGADMIKLTWEARNEPEFEGAIVYDYLITDGSMRGAGMAKRKLEALGIDTKYDVDDSEICNRLLGLEVDAVIAHEQSKDAQGVLQFTHNANGARVPVMSHKINEYIPAARTTAQAAPQVQVPAPMQPQAMPGYQPGPQQAYQPMPQPGYPQVPQGYQPPPQQAYAQVPQGYQPQPMPLVPQAQQQPQAQVQAQAQQQAQPQPQAQPQSPAFTPPGSNGAPKARVKITDQP